MYPLNSLNKRVYNLDTRLLDVIIETRMLNNNQAVLSRDSKGKTPASNGS